MERKLNRTDMSDLEFELEMDEDEPVSRESDLDEDREPELEGAQPDEEFEEPDAADFGERFYEVVQRSQRNHEVAEQADDHFDRILSEIEDVFYRPVLSDHIASEIESLSSRADVDEREYLFGGLRKRLRRLGRFAKNAAIKGVTRFATGALKGGLLKPLASSALMASLGPLGPAASLVLAHGPKMLGALKSLGLSPAPQDPPAARHAWTNYANFAQNAYRQLAGNPDAVDDPMGAAQAAFDAALRMQSQPQPEESDQELSPGTARLRRGGSRVLHLSKGDRLVIKVK